MINKIAVIGVGLIGGSLIRALRKASAVKEVIGYDRNTAQLQSALKQNIIDVAKSAIDVTIADANIIVIATPVGAIQQIFEQISPFINKKVTVTDVGSTKVSVINDCKNVFGELPTWFVPGHPIAGTEKSGVNNSFANLFTNRQVILTPTKTTDGEKINLVRSMWQLAGAKVSLLKASEHDRILAAASHLPHVLAFALMHYLKYEPEVFHFSGGGFKDFTRIASSDPKMWHDICLANSKEIARLIKGYKNSLSHLEMLIETNDSAHLLESFIDAKLTRDTNLNKQ